MRVLASISILSFSFFVSTTFLWCYMVYLHLSPNLHVPDLNRGHPFFIFLARLTSTSEQYPPNYSWIFRKTTDPTACLIIIPRDISH